MPHQDSEHDCKEQYCSGGKVATRDKDSEKPDDPCKECRGGKPQNVTDYTPPRDSADHCEVCKQGRSYILPEHTTDQTEYEKSCPDKSLQDPGIPYLIDGCTNSPDSLRVWALLPGTRSYRRYVTNPIWGQDLGSVPRSSTQTLACNLHDVCYQTCGSDKGACDAALGAGITASCDVGYPLPCPLGTAALCTEYLDEYQSCRGIGPIYVSGVSTPLGTSAYQERQRQNCYCCNK